MDATSMLALTDYCGGLIDPRVERTKHHLLVDIVTITICAVICGAETWDDIALFGETKHRWFATFLALPHGIPSHDTFNRVFAALNPDQFRAGFTAWMQSVAGVLPTQVIAINGKTVRRSHDRHQGRSAIHMVSAWASANRLVLAQVKVTEKSHEITAIPLLLRQLAIEGCVVTIDAMGCQREITHQIVAQEANYVLALKENQPDLADDVAECFVAAQEVAYAGVRHEWHESITKGHGRREIRRHTVISDPEHLAWVQAVHHWPGVVALGCVESGRRSTTEQTQEVRFYLLSQVMSAQAFGAAVRSHWGIENSVHWVLDVTFDEDHSRMRAGFAAENMAVVRHIAPNLLKQTRVPKPLSITGRRLKAGWDTSFLLQVLSAI